MDYRKKWNKITKYHNRDLKNSFLTQSFSKKNITDPRLNEKMKKKREKGEKKENKSTLNDVPGSYS